MSCNDGKIGDSLSEDLIFVGGDKECTGLKPKWYVVGQTEV